LLIRRAYDPFKNHLALPGGFVDYNEDPEEGCLRELSEECNLQGKSIEFVKFYFNIIK
jgi:8-oxo-dGTP diphosphatase